MNETIHERISSLVNVYGDGKNTVFASKIGVSEGNIRGYVKGIMPKQDVLAKIVRCCEGLNPLWLLTGEGSMVLPANTEGAETVSVPENTGSVPEKTSPRLVSPGCLLDMSQRLLDELTAQRRMFETQMTKTNELCDRLMTLLEQQSKR